MQSAKILPTCNDAWYLLHLILIYLPNPCSGYKPAEGNFYSRHSDTNSMKIFHHTSFIFPNLHFHGRFISFQNIVNLPYTINFTNALYSLKISSIMQHQKFLIHKLLHLFTNVLIPSYVHNYIN